MTCSVHTIVKEALDNYRTERGKPLVEGQVVILEEAFSLFNNDISRRLKEEYQVESDENVFLVSQATGTVQKADYYGYLEKYKYTRWVFNGNLLDKLEYNRLNPPVSLQITQGIFDPELAEKLQNKLQQLYPEIRLNITNTPVWEQGDNIFNQEEYNSKINYRFKTTEKVLDNLDKIKQWESNKSITPEILWKKIQELGIPKEQLTLLKESKGNTVEEKLASFISNYSYTVKTEVAKEALSGADYYARLARGEKKGYSVNNFAGKWNVFSPENEIVAQFETEAEARKEQTRLNKLAGSPTQYYASLTVPGGTNYTENEIITPEIIPFEKGHAQFATVNGIGWFRSDDRQINLGGAELSEEYAPDIEQLSNGKWEVSYMPITGGRKLEFFKTEQEAKDFVKTITKTSDEKTRRILEVQSDLFQKGRDKEELSKTPVSKKLLNKLKNVGVDIGQKFNVKGTWFEVFAKKTEGTTTLYHVKNLLNETKTSWVTSETIYNAVKDYYETKDFSNNFLQLLNKNNNWVNFFVKSIIQDSAKKGYEKVLFPSGNTASKVEGHTTLEEFKKQKEDRIKELEEKLKNIKQESSDIYTKDGRYAAVKFQLERLKQGIIPESYSTSTNLGGLLDSNISAFYHKGQIAIWQNKDINSFSEKFAKEESENQHGVKFWILKDNLQKDLIEVSLNNLENEFKSLPKEILKREKESTNNEINQLKQELARVETEGFAALAPIYNFYENTVFNVLKKQGYSPMQITDEYGNTWNEVTINQARDLGEVLLQRNQANKIIGQANIKAMTVLIDAINQKQDTLPHEYAHHYIAWFRDTPLVQEAISKWGSEEALVQSIGEQAVKQKGEAWNWWKRFVNWLLGDLRKLSKLDKERLTKILTDAFLSRRNLSKFFGEVKPGVAELFDSNPELANAVYEAVGIGKFRVTLGNELDPEQKFGSQGEPIVKKFEVLDENKKIIGTVTLDIEKRGAITAHPKLTTIGKGYGQELYQIISLKFGAPVIEWGPHNISKSIEGKKLWNSLEKKGLAKAKYQWDDDIYLRGIDLSQQKQQALQLYSQYLDQIFPDSKVKDIVYHKTSSKEIEGGKFKISRLGGVYFSFFDIPSGGLLKGLFQKLIKENTIVALVDVKNPFIVNRNNAKEIIKKTGLTTQDVTKLRKNFDLSTNDAVLGFPNETKDTGQLDNFPTISFNEKDRKDIIELAVFEPEQIHILGSKQDIEGFKEFVKGEEAQEEYLREKESQERLTDFYMGDFVLKEQELRDLEEFRNNNSNMPDEDIDDYFLGCKL